MAFKPATRAGTKALIGLYGESGSGKTYSALLLARGLVGPAGKVFMVDTENRRGEMYFDKIPGGYEADQLEPPFSSNRYSEMIGSAEKAAGDAPAALVIDSFSHEWEGIGGVCNAAENISETRAKKWGKPWDGTVQFGDWKTPKADHKRMVLRMLGSKLHIICCLRAQFKSHQVDQKDYAKYGIQSNAKTTVIRDEFQTPIQDASFIYEMTIHAELNNKAAGVPRLTKCPDMLLPAFPMGKQIDTSTGEAIAAWLEGGAPPDLALESAAIDAEMAALNGLKAYSEFWNAQTNATRAYLVQSGKHESCKKAAEIHDNPPYTTGEEQETT